MSCFSRYCLNKQKQPIKAQSPPINNQPVSAPIINGPNINTLTYNTVPVLPAPITYNNGNIQNAGLQNNIYNNINGYAAQERAMVDKEINEKIVGWAEDKTQTQKKLDKLGQTIYIIQIGKSQSSRNRVSLNADLNRWAFQDVYNQFSRQAPRRYSIPTTINTNQLKDKFPDPFIRYKIIPCLNQTMTIDVTTQNNPQKKITRGNLIVWNYHGGPNQLFYVRQSRQPNVYYFVSLSSGFVLTSQNNHDSYRKDIIPITANPHEDNRPEQLWILTPSQNSSFIIQSFANPNMVIDLYKERAQNDTPIILWQKTGRKNQRWLLLSA